MEELNANFFEVRKMPSGKRLLFKFNKEISLREDKKSFFVDY